MPFCVRSGKEILSSQAAKTALASVRRLGGTPRRTYKCKHCCGWHMTSKEAKPKTLREVLAVREWLVSVDFSDGQVKTWKIRSQSRATAWTWLASWAGAQPKPVMTICIHDQGAVT